MVYNPVKPKIIHELVIAADGGQSKERVFKVEGYGDWESSELFKYIM